MKSTQPRPDFDRCGWPCGFEAARISGARGLPSGCGTCEPPNAFALDADGGVASTSRRELRRAGCKKGDNVVLETVPERTRCVTVAMRSYRGSREALMNAASWLIGDNAHLGEVPDASRPKFLRPEGAEPGFAASTVTYCNQLSIAELLRRLRAVEERLRPSPDPDSAHPTLKFELWWVEGLHGTFGALELPSPLILDEVWANHFVCGRRGNRRQPSGGAGSREQSMGETRGAHVPTDHGGQCGTGALRRRVPASK